MAAANIKSAPTYLFSPERLSRLSRWPEIEAQLARQNLRARPLSSQDHEHGYLDLLARLTQVGNVSGAQFAQRFQRMLALNQLDEHYAIVVIEDKTTRKLVAASTLHLELKFIHDCAVRGRLEDVVVLDGHRGKQVGELVVKIIVELARQAYKCYKLSLDCKDELVGFYAKNEFARGANMLCIRF